MPVERGLLERPALEVAPLLLGAVLSRGLVSVRITEVEAYLGENDPGSHAFRGRTPRTLTMFGPPGHPYVYFSYGMHVCANVVCSPEGEASAVLLRAGEIVAGLDEARERRPTAHGDTELARGPARLTKSLGIVLDDDGADASRSPFDLELPTRSAEFVTGPRTGVSGLGGGIDYPWRLWMPGEASVSPYRKSARRPPATGVGETRPG